MITSYKKSMMILFSILTLCDNNLICQYIITKYIIFIKNYFYNNNIKKFTIIIILI